MIFGLYAQIFLIIKPAAWNYITVKLPKYLDVAKHNAQGTQQAWLEIPIKSTSWDEGHVQIYNAAEETGC